MTLQTMVRRPAGPLSLAARSADSRRLRRRPGLDPRFYCGTNGCTTSLAYNASSGIAKCPICGFRRTIA